MIGAYAIARDHQRTFGFQTNRTGEIDACGRLVIARRTFDIGFIADGPLDDPKTFRGRAAITAELQCDVGRTLTTWEHEPIENPLSFTASGHIRWSIRGGGESSGQNLDEIRSATVYRPGPDAHLLPELYDLWDEWHLNTMQSSCIHQSISTAYRTSRQHGGPDYGTPEYRAIVDRENRKCPHGYRWGSQWLVKPITPDAERRIRAILGAN